MKTKRKDTELFHILNHMHHGGCQKIVYEIFSKLEVEGYSKTLIANSGHYINLLNQSTKYTWINRKKFGFWKILKNLIIARRSSNKFILHTHNRRDLIFGLLLRNRDVHVHTYHSAYLDKNMFMGLFRSQISVSISQTVNEYLQKFNISSTTIYNGVDFNQSKYTKQNINQKSPKILYMGRLSKEKGVYELLDLFLGLDDQDYDTLNLDLIGDGLLMEDCKKLVDNRQNKHHTVNFLGYKENPWDECNKYDLVVIPSFYEGFCLVAVEAAIRGIPIMANDIPALREILYFLPEESFFCIQNRHSFEKSLKYTINNWSGLNLTIKAKQEELKDKFGVGTMIRKYEKLYDVALSENL